MNKGEFIKSVADKAGLTQKEASAAYEAMVETIVDAFKADDKVTLVGFGTFELKSKPARTGINPQTKQPVKIAASKAPCFKVGKAFKDLFN